MSYILDALRKSEQERAAVTTPTAMTSEDETPRQTSSIRRSWPLAAFLLIVLFLGGFLYRRGEPTPEAKPVVAAAQALPPEATNRERDLNQELAAPPPRRTAVVAQQAQQAVTHAPSMNVSQAPYLRELPSDFQQQLPALKIDIHVFTPGGQSILYINNREYRPGEQIQNGLRVEAVVQEGAVLSYNGQAFKLPRPNR